MRNSTHQPPAIRTFAAPSKHTMDIDGKDPITPFSACAQSATTQGGASTSSSYTAGQSTSTANEERPFSPLLSTSVAKDNFMSPLLRSNGSFSDSNGYSCFVKGNFPIFTPRYSIPPELLSPTKPNGKLNGGSVSDAITDGTTNARRPTPPPQQLVNSPSQQKNQKTGEMTPININSTGTSTPPLVPATKPLFYETNLCLSDFIKAVYGIVGPTTGKGGRDVGTSALTKDQRLQYRRMLYKNASPLHEGGGSNNSLSDYPPSSPNIISNATNTESPSLTNNSATANMKIGNSPSRSASVLTSSPLVGVNGKLRKLLLVLDLDETLVHAFIGLKQPLPGADAHVEITTTLGNPPRKSINAMYIRYRPGISEFMSAVAPLFDVMLFTAARPIYADTLMNVMDPRGSVIAKGSRYFRDACTDVYNKYESSASSPSLSFNPSTPGQAAQPIPEDKEMAAAVAAEAGCDVNGLPPLAEPGFVRTKDLMKLGRPLEEIILVDNTPLCGLFQPRNLLPISSWYGTDTKDDGLLKIIPVLQRIAQTRDVYGVLDEYCASVQPMV